VVGLGKSGAAAARLLTRLGTDVSVSEKRPRAQVAAWLKELPAGVSVETGGHASLSKSWDLAVTSPGVPAAVWRPLAERGVPVWGEMELGFRVLSLAGRWPERTAAVTGTNGKTTTTALLAEMFKAADFPAVAAGNIGTPLCAAAERITARTALALEVSSYQLEAAQTFRAAAGAVLNVTPDHLARHGDMENYARAKFRVFQNGGAALLNAADAWDRRLARTVRGKVYWFGLRHGLGARAGCPCHGEIFWDGRRMVSHIPGAEGSWEAPPHLPGDHNLENALAAAGLARLCGVPPEAVGRALAEFRGVEHRIEFVREFRGVRYYNDSKGTNVDSTLVALKAFPRGGIHLLLGGQDKGAPYTPLGPLVRRRVRAAYLIGEAAPKIRKDLDGAAPFVASKTLDAALRQAAGAAVPGEVVLLSPACASFDQFQNYEQRGRVFKDLVNSL
jgi:UDP-N-acetylmuramoylalanine--D-glutamate ligase